MTNPRPIFISYRRDDSAGHAGRLHDRLRQDFGPELVFFDVDAIPIGTDFLVFLHKAIASSRALVAVIGPNWLDARDRSGNRRLDDPNDIVRIEIETALDSGIPIFPVLLDGAAVPDVGRLPPNMQPLARVNAIQIRHQAFHSDIDKLAAALEKQFIMQPAGVTATASENLPEERSGSSPRPYHYDAVVIGTHHEVGTADRLVKSLRRFSVPKTLVQTRPDLGPIPTKLRVFGDKYSLEAGSLSLDELNKAIASCRNLVVLCSPSAARSQYLERDIEEFISSGDINNIIPVLISGDLGVNDESPFPIRLRTRINSSQLQIVDARGLPSRGLVIAVAARILGVPTGRLVRHADAAIRKWRISTIGLTLIVIAACVLFAVARYYFDLF